EPDAAAASALTGVGPALADEFFPAKRGAAVASLAGNDIDAGFVDDIHESCKEGEPHAVRRTRQSAQTRTIGPQQRRSESAFERTDGDVAALLRAFDGDFDDTVFQGEERVVAPDADVVARMELGAALPHDDVAGDHELAGVALHAEPFRFGVAAVTG